jgi:CheY-like chemotaxis protein
MSDHILVVDDNPINLKLASHVLRGAGYVVQTAKDAESALELMRAQPPRLLLLDLQLPVMDGLTLARILKGDERTRHVPIVALTAFAMKGDEERAREAGCDGYISKPIDVETFTRQVEHHLNHRAPRANP